MMEVGIVPVFVPQRAMPVVMRVWLARGITRFVGVLMVDVMPVRMTVFQCLM